MNDGKRYISLKTKLVISTIVPVAICLAIICSVIFSYLFNSIYDAARSEFLQIGRKYAEDFEYKINSALNYLSIVSSTMETQIQNEPADRETMQKTIWNIFDDYRSVDGSSVYFEPDMYDGKDSEYIGSWYGTSFSGRICWYYYMDGGRTGYLPEALENEEEFTMPHYTEAFEADGPFFTKPVVYEINGKKVPMFTITYPIRDRLGNFAGAVTVDLFLEDLYNRIQESVIYETGYVLIANSDGYIIYSPRPGDIGKTRDEAGLHYALPEDGISFLNAESLVNGKDTFVAIDTIQIPQLNGDFYISVTAPIAEINASGTKLIALLITFCVSVIVLIGSIMFYLVGRISAPIREITQSADGIANGTETELVFDDKSVRRADEIYKLAGSMKKMLDRLNEGEKLKLEALTLKHGKERAEAAAQAKNQFLAKMSHEIRTPMNAVVGMTELILRKELPQDVYESASMIKSAGANLLSIINDILDFSKIEAGMLEIVNAEYMLPSLLNDVLNVTRIRLLEKSIQFVAYVDPDTPAALIGDEVRIRQTIINLLSNAVKYTNEGFISLNVTYKSSEEGAMVTFDIADSGIGIKKDDLARLFVDFVRFDMDKNKGVEGTGLGLVIAQSLCKAMGGDISVKSEHGKGSVFSIILPQKFTEYMPFASVENKEEKSVLLYETRRYYRESIEKTLAALGISYESVENIPALFDGLGNYTFVFISSYMYGSVAPVLAEWDNPPVLTLISDITDTKVPKDARMLIMPVHALSVANVLNGIHSDYGEADYVGASFTAPDARVLIVDDIAANLKVGEGLMQPYEMKISLCVSGKEAIELVSANHFDLVFMDHMMPEMDGIEATKIIKAMDGEYYKNLPIIALTANAVLGVREIFVQNGMSDFLAKPIETAKLNAILEKWIPKEKKRKAKPVSEVCEEPESALLGKLRGVSALSVEKALGVMGGLHKTYERAVRLSAGLLPEDIKTLDGLLRTNLKNYAIAVHGMKGVLNNIGAYELGKTALTLENLSKEGDMEGCGRIHPVFIKELTAFSAEIMELIEEADRNASKESGDKSALMEGIQKMAEAADFFDALTALEIIQPLREYTFGRETDGILEKLEKGFEAMDFTAAGGLLDELKKLE